MPPTQQSPSFIPKKPLDTRGVYRESGGFGILFFISLFIFLASVVGAGGVFGYESFLKSSIKSKADSLRKDQQAFDPDQINKLVKLDSRINNAKTLLARHVAPSAIFDFLSQQTLERVQFTSFDYTLNTDNTASIKLDGVADSFSTVALQSDQFIAASSALKEVVFSNVKTAEGRITFSVSATIDPSLINYAKNLGSPIARPVTTPTPQSTSTPSTGQ